MYLDESKHVNFIYLFIYIKFVTEARETAIKRKQTKMREKNAHILFFLRSAQEARPGPFVMACV